MAVHIFRVGLAGSSLFRSLQYRRMVSYITYRSAAVSPGGGGRIPGASAAPGGRTTAPRRCEIGRAHV